MEDVVLGGRGGLAQGKAEDEAERNEEWCGGRAV